LKIIINDNDNDNENYNDNENDNENDNDNLILNYWGKATQALFLLLGAISSNNN